jgi:RNA polymerase sigma-70 factor (ECF subfamily)
MTIVWEDTQRTMNERSMSVRSLQGDLGAFNRLAGAHLGEAFNLAYFLVNDSDAAATAIQDSLIEAFRRLEHLREGERFRAWFLHVVIDACHTVARTCPADAGPHDSTDVGTVQDQGRVRAGLWPTAGTCLQLLPYELRATLLLHYTVDYPYSEIAIIMGLPAEVIQDRVGQAHRLLRDSLKHCRQGGQTPARL